jgi:hypothetical protein
MKRIVVVPFILILLSAASAVAGLGIPKPAARDLAKPFTGAAVSRAWLGTWRVTTPSDDSGVLWRIRAASSPWCKSITAGRTTCFTLQPPGHLELWAGSITVAGGKAILRMTYRPRPNTFGCFADDAYRYRISARTLTFKGGPHACFFTKPSALSLINR